MPFLAGLDHEWDVDTYGELLKIGGGKERMLHYFTVPPLFLMAKRVNRRRCQYN